MAPLSKEIRPITSSTPPHLGPASPEINTVWFKLFIYFISGYGPPSILFSKGTRLRRLPHLLKSCDKVLVTTWEHDPIVLPINNLIFTVNEALCHSAVLVQGFGVNKQAKTVLVPFPMHNAKDQLIDWSSHPAIKKLAESIDLQHNCGFLTMVNLNSDVDNENILLKRNNNHFGSSNSVVDSWIENQLNIRAVPEITSPVNGITNRESAEILEEELDNLACARNLDEATDAKMLNEDCLISENIETDLMKWTLLDCDFGIPLFNAKTNLEVCDSICTHKLWTKNR